MTKYKKLEWAHDLFRKLTWWENVIVWNQIQFFT